VRTGKPYPKYKDSGVEWLGQVPEGWEVRKLKHISKMKSGDNITSLFIEEKGTYPVYGEMV
jgi:type I restriction enzyme S subunit